MELFCSGMGTSAEPDQEHCAHRSMLSTHGPSGAKFTCGDCGAALDDPRGCQHYRIDNETGQCVQCGELMIGKTVNAETVLSAPNLAACTNPGCLEALEAGTYDETDPPPGCTNMHGFYIPDRNREREVVIGWNVTYECQRCSNNSDQMTMDARGVVWPCGGVHRGERIPVPEEVDA
jgi:hypothetical protein